MNRLPLEKSSRCEKDEKNNLHARLWSSNDVKLINTHQLECMWNKTHRNSCRHMDYIQSYLSPLDSFFNVHLYTKHIYDIAWNLVRTDTYWYRDSSLILFFLTPQSSLMPENSMKLPELNRLQSFKLTFLLERELVRCLQLSTANIECFNNNRQHWFHD